MEFIKNYGGNTRDFDQLEWNPLTGEIGNTPLNDLMGIDKYTIGALKLEPANFLIANKARKSFCYAFKQGLDTTQEIFYRNLIESEVKFEEPSSDFPRQAAWYTGNGCTCRYEYSGRRYDPIPMTVWQKMLANRIADKCNLEYVHDAINFNKYMGKRDRCGEHADGEKLFGGPKQRKHIASVTFGNYRTFGIRYKNKQEQGESIQSGSGQILVMDGLTQTHYIHGIPYDPEITQYNIRYNATFRHINQHNNGCPCGNKEKVKRFVIGDGSGDGNLEVLPKECLPKNY